jgi:hypothetical protein
MTGYAILRVAEGTKLGPQSVVSRAAHAEHPNLAGLLVKAECHLSQVNFLQNPRPTTGCVLPGLWQDF